MEKNSISEGSENWPEEVQGLKQLKNDVN
nr:gustatory receptor [Semanotus bifasciatus]UTN00900.1 gustatory receptor [Semanotus bifasciatus]